MHSFNINKSGVTGPGWQEGATSTSMEVTSAANLVALAAWVTWEGKEDQEFEDGCCLVLAEVAVDFRPGENDLICCVPLLSWLPLIKALKKPSSFKYVLKC